MSEKKDSHAAGHTALDYHRLIKSLCARNDVPPFDIDNLSSKAERGSDSDDSLSSNQPSNLSSPSTRSPTPFVPQLAGIATWDDQSKKDFAAGYHMGVESLVPSNNKEACSISQGHRRALETMHSYDETAHKFTPLDFINPSLTWRRQHSVVAGVQDFPNVPSRTLDDDEVEKGTRLLPSLFDSQMPFIEDPEKLKIVGSLRTSQHRHVRGIKHIVLLVALILGIVLYRLWICGGDLDAL